MMNLNIVARFNTTNANTFQVLRNELMEAFGGGLNYLGYTNVLLSCIHVNTTQLRNSMCTLVATSAILQNLEFPI